MLKYFVSTFNFNLQNIFSHTNSVKPGQSDLKTFSRLKLPYSLLFSNKCQLNSHTYISTKRDLLKEIDFLPHEWWTVEFCRIFLHITAIMWLCLQQQNKACKETLCKAQSCPERFLDTWQCFQNYFTVIWWWILAPHGGETRTRQPVRAARPPAFCCSVCRSLHCSLRSLCVHSGRLSLMTTYSFNSIVNFEVEFVLFCDIIV